VAGQAVVGQSRVHRQHTAAHNPFTTTVLSQCRTKNVVFIVVCLTFLSCSASTLKIFDRALQVHL
jgi:hypothetical protein